MKTLHSLIILFSIITFSCIGFASAQTQNPDSLISWLSSPSYGSGYNGNYYLIGDHVEFSGVVQDNQNIGIVSGAQVKIFIDMPNGTTTMIKDIIADNSGHFDFNIQLTDNFEIGKYVVRPVAQKEGYQTQQDTTMDIFYVARSNAKTITVEGLDFPVRLESIEFKTDNLTFNKEAKSLSFDVKKLPGKYAADDDLQFKNSVDLVFKRPLISEPFHVYGNGEELYVYPISKNNASYYLQIHIPESLNASNISVIATYAAPEFPTGLIVLVSGFFAMIVIYSIKK